jgi:hypothetical protein
MSEEKTCFVICPIGEENTPIRKRSDQIFKHVIEEVLSNHKYKGIRADKISTPGIITSQVIENLINCDLVIADLSGHNPNVFYELAIRHATQKPVIHFIERDEKIPFDISGLRTIQIVTKEFDLDSIEKAKEEIGNQIKSIEDGSNCGNPIFETLKIILSKESKDVNQMQLGDIYAEIQNLRLQILSKIDELSKPVDINQPQFGNWMKLKLRDDVIRTTDEWEKIFEIIKGSSLETAKKNK